MSDKEKSIVDAAVDAFLRYGVKRTSMQDIAEAAGISRQTLYNSFSSKDDILRASIRFYTEAALTSIRARIATNEDMAARVRAVLDEIAMKPFAAIHASPNAQDLIDGFNEAGRTELEDGAAQYRGVLAEIFAPHADRLRAAGLTPAILAETVQRAGAAFKYQAQSEVHLSSLLDGLVAMVSSTLAGPPSSKGPQ